MQDKIGHAALARFAICLRGCGLYHSWWRREARDYLGEPEDVSVEQLLNFVCWAVVYEPKKVTLHLTMQAPSHTATKNTPILPHCLDACVYVGMHIFWMNKRERREGQPDVVCRLAGCVSGSSF